ncbi:hypothetical protein WK25_23425 [Burkholderia latens]|nr:hypothetical protein WK25_23425 [Burkholderia latens]
MGGTPAGTAVAKGSHAANARGRVGWPGIRARAAQAATQRHDAAPARKMPGARPASIAVCAAAAAAAHRACRITG